MQRADACCFLMQRADACCSLLQRADACCSLFRVCLSPSILSGLRYWLGSIDVVFET